MQKSPEFPAGFEQWDSEKQQAWWDAFYNTAEGRKHYERANGYAVTVRSDGSFRIDDVPEGHYRLNFEYAMVAIEVLPAEPKDIVPTKVAVLATYLDVPAGPAAKPLDLGVLEMTPPEPDVVDR